VTAAWVIIALLVLGVPLLAWWIGGRRFWGRLEVRGGQDPASAILRRYGLTGGQASTVSTAVMRGRALDEPRQCAAAVELAQLMLDQLFPTWEHASTGRRAVRILAWLWVLTAVVGFAHVAVSDGLGDVNWFTVVLVMAGVVTPFVQRRRLRRTIELNSAAGDRAG
jgi:hypothetical protein